MKQLLATTAVLLAIGPTALGAQEAPAAGSPAGEANGAFIGSATEGDLFASDLIGTDVYATEDEIGDQTVTGDLRAGWDDIGEINDILLSQDGRVEAVLVDVGGFLGVGERTVALDMSQVHVMTDDTGSYFAALTTTREMLESAPEFQRLDATAPVADAPSINQAGPADSMAADTTPEAEGYVPLAATDITSDRLEGATVYNSAGESIGEISELVVDGSGKITQAILDVGGFLGMGAHTVALSFEDLDVRQNPETNDVRVYVNATDEELRQLPEYEG